MHPLDGVRLKLSRADEHLQALQSEIRRYINSRPYARVREYHPEHREVTVAFSVVQPPPEHLSVVVGDFTHNVRSALDHLACELVMANGGSPTDKTAFPIFDSRYDNKGRVRRVGVAGGVAPSALTLIESLQPYHRGEAATDHPLSLVGSLSNVDKHRRLLAVAHWVPDLEWATWNVPPGVSRSDTETIYFLRRALIPDDDDDADVYLQAALLVSLEEPPGLREKDVALGLQELLAFVRQGVLPRFAPFFD